MPVIREIGRDFWLRYALFNCTQTSDVWACPTFVERSQTQLQNVYLRDLLNCGLGYFRNRFFFLRTWVFRHARSSTLDLADKSIYYTISIFHLSILDIRTQKIPDMIRGAFLVGLLCLDCIPCAMLERTTMLQEIPKSHNFRHAKNYCIVWDWLRRPRRQEVCGTNTNYLLAYTVIGSDPQ